MSFVAFRRQDEIGEIIETQKQHYWDLSEDTSEQSNATHSYKGNKKQTSGTLIEVEGAQNGTSKEERKGRKPWGFRKTKGSQKSVEEKSEEEQKQNATKSVVLPGPTFNERHLHDESLLQLRNDTLGVGTYEVYPETMIAKDAAVRSSLCAQHAWSNRQIGRLQTGFIVDKLQLRDSARNQRQGCIFEGFARCMFHCSYPPLRMLLT